MRSYRGNSRLEFKNRANDFNIVRARIHSLNSIKAVAYGQLSAMCISYSRPKF